MDTLKSALYVSLKRPGASLFMSIVIFIYSYFETNILGTGVVVLVQFASMGKNSNIMDSIMTLIVTLKGLLKIENYLIPIAGYIFVILFVSIIISFVFSGYFYVISNIVKKEKKFVGEFFTGVRKYYARFLKATIISLFVSSLVIIFLVVASVPAILSTAGNDVNNSIKSLLITVLLDLISLFMVFFGVMFLRMYILFWYPSIYSTETNTFKTTKMSVDKYFWDVVEKFMAFDVAFILFQILYLILYSKVTGNSFLVWILIGVNWIFKSLYFIAFITYIFRAFKFYKENSVKNSKKMNKNESSGNEFGQGNYDDQYYNQNLNYNYNQSVQNKYNSNKKPINKNIKDNYDQYNNY